MFLLLFSIYLLVVFFVFFFFFSFGPLWVLIAGLKPKEAYLKSARTVRKFNEAHSDARLSLKETNKGPT